MGRGGIRQGRLGPKGGRLVATGWVFVAIFGLSGLVAAPSAVPAPASKLPLSVRVPGVKSSDFGDPDLCGTCHVEIFRQWSASMHRTYTNPAFVWANGQAAKDTKGETKDFCIECHTPIGAVTGENGLISANGLSALAKKGVSCDFCHTIDRVNPDWPGNASFHVSPGRVKRGPYKDSVAPKHKTAYSKLHTEAEFCGMCHNLSHPTSGIPLENTYTEWKNSSYAKKGVVCQDCHMPPKPGRAATRGPKRDKVFAHTFVGANYRFAEKNLAVANLQKSAKLALSMSGTQITPGNQLSVSVKVTNVGAGHYLPTGLTELREMWLEVRAHDSEGNKLFAERHDFGTVLENAQGVHDRTVPIWAGVKIYSDRRVPPNGSLTEDFAFPAKTSATGFITVDATLWYRSLPPSFTKQAGLAPVAEVRMARASGRVKVKPTWWSVIFGGFLGAIVWLPEVLFVVVFVLLVLVLLGAWRSRRRKPVT